MLNIKNAKGIEICCVVMFRGIAIFSMVARGVTFEERLEVGSGERSQSIWKKRYNPEEKANAES